MATKVGQELVEFSFSQEKTDLGNGVFGYDPKNLDRFTKTVEAYERELKRVFGSLVTTVSQIDQATGQAVHKMYLPKQYEREALGVRSAVDLQMFGAQGMNSKEAKDLFYQGQQGAHFLETTREIKGAKAQQFAKESVIESGGRIIHTPNTANKDMMTTFIPISDTQLGSMSKKDVALYVRDVTPASNSASRAEQIERTRKEREAQLERDAQHQRQNLKDIKRQNEIQKKADERKQREEAKAQAQEEKDKIASRKHLLGTIGKIVGLTAMLVNIARRILTSVLNFGGEYSKTVTKAGTLNISAQDIRAYDYLDRALGLDVGTQIQGQEDLRSKFGNTAKLDTEALKWLAMVMGDKVGQMVQSGLGGENPAYLMEQILDDFYKRQQEGKDQYGNYVGQDKARRALVTLLESVSPAIARTFERMVEEQTSGLHAGEITSYRQLQSFYTPSTMGLGALDWDSLKTFGDQVNELKAKFFNLGELIKTDVAGALSDFVGKLNNLHIGQNEEEAFLEDLEDLKVLQKWEKTYKESRQSTAESLGAFFTGYGLSDMSIEDIIKYAGYQVSGTEGEERARIINAQKAMTALYADPNMFNTLLTYYASGDLIDAITKEYSEKNPNADPSKYGEAVGLAKAKGKAESKYLSLLGYLNSGGISFTQELFTKDIGSGDLKYGDVVDPKKQYFARGAEEFFDTARLLGDKTNYGKALADMVSNWNKTFGSSFKVKYIRGLADKMSAGTANDNEKRILYDLFTFGTMSSSVSANTRTLAQSLAMYLPDEYGLTTGEWREINNTIGNMKGSKYATNTTWTELKQGATAGKIDIVMHVMGADGKEIKEIKKTISGTIDKDFKYEDAIRDLNN